jgi:glycosyltransferase involved in cell wall biosynthesis
MPLAVRSYNLDAFDVVLTCSHSMTKSVRIRSGQLHLCYCCTPPRYLWDLEDQYLSTSRFGAAARPLIRALRAWDRHTAAHVHYFSAISTFTRDRIRRYYDRDAELIFPPCDVVGSPLAPKEDYYITVGRFAAYKRTDLIVRAFNRLGRRLVVVGDGPGLDELRDMAASNVRFTGWVSDEERSRLLARARAFIFAAEEDFGIAPVEAQACGTPVIGFGRGGLLDTVVPYDLDPERATGIFFPEQNENALMDGVRRFEEIESKFQPAALKSNAERFSIDRFRREFRAFFDRRVSQFLTSP